MERLDPRIAEALQRLPDYLGQHVLLSISALALGILISVPLGLAAARAPRLRRVLLGVASVVQTIPSLALLALFYPLLLALSLLAKNLIGAQFSALGFLPSLLALTLYSMLPILRNTVTGIAGVDARVTEAARGVGMTPRQSLFQVELPLALPVLMAGVRTAAVWVIGAATLSTPVGQTSLGNYIFTGLQTQNWIFVLFGCVAAALLALAVDQLLALAETALAQRNRRKLVAALAALVLGLAASLAAPLTRADTQYVVGAKGFSEQYILAALLAQRLNAAGLPVTTRGNLGSAVIFTALAAGDVDVYVDYSGTLWANAMGRTDTPPRAQLLRELDAWLEAEHGVRDLGTLGFENAYALALPRRRAEELGVRTIADLARFAPRMTVGGDYEIFGRPEWRALRAAYGFKFREERVMQPEFMYRAAADGEVDAITAFSSDGRIAQFDLAVLADPRQAIPPYDAVVLISPRRKDDAALLAALKPLLGRISIQRMREANLTVSRDKDQLPPDEAARRLWQAIAPPR
jgi:osmoprotectant transport system permease protein